MLPDPRRIVRFVSLRSRAAEIAEDLGVTPRFTYGTALFGFAGPVPEGRIGALEEDPRVVLVERDLPVYAIEQTLPAGIDRIEADQNATAAIDGSPTGVNVDIGIIDTGIDLDHGDLNAVDGANCIDSGASADDDHGHGTHVAGSAAAIDDNEDVVGAGVFYAVAAGNDAQDVYGSDNEFGTSDDFIPAAYPEVAAVSAMADFDGTSGAEAGSQLFIGCGQIYDDALADCFTNYSTNVVSGNPVTSSGAAIDVAAPGVSVLSTQNGGDWQTATYNSDTGYYEDSWDTTAEDDGDHNLDARATDSAGNSSTATITVTVDNTTDSDVNMHVGDLDGNSINNGSTWTAEVTVTVHDPNHDPLSDTDVTLSYDGRDVSGTVGCVTESHGTCTVSVSSIPKRTGDVTFAVEDVSHQDHTYDANDNHDPDGDSDGTSITVTKP